MRMINLNYDTVTVKVDLSDVLGELLELLQEDDQTYYPFDHHGIAYEVYIKEDKERAPADKIEKAFNYVMRMLKEAENMMDPGDARTKVHEAYEVTKAIRYEYWTAWKEEEE